MESCENVESSGKAAKLWSQYRWYIAASTAIVAVVFSGTELQALDRFGETFTSKLCDILPASSVNYILILIFTYVKRIVLALLTLPNFYYCFIEVNR